MRALLIICAVGLCLPAGAQSGWSLTVGGGVQAFMNAQSFNLGHRLKPTIRLEGEYRLSRAITVGAELVGNVSDANYRLVGGYLNTHAHLYRGTAYQLSILAGTGVGAGPPILSHDLRGQSDVRFWFQWGLEHRWQVVDGLMSSDFDLIS